MGKYSFVALNSPHLPHKGQHVFTYLTTEEEVFAFSRGVITIDYRPAIQPDKKTYRDVINQRYLRYCVPAVELKSKNFEISNGLGITEVVTTSKGKVKIVYTSINANVIYFKTQDKRLYRAYYAEVSNLAKVSKDGYTPLDKSTGTGNIVILAHNKRNIVKSKPYYIHNRLKNIMAYVDAVFDSEEEMMQDYENENVTIDLGVFIDSII